MLKKLTANFPLDPTIYLPPATGMNTREPLGQPATLCRLFDVSVECPGDQFPRHHRGRLSDPSRAGRRSRRLIPDMYDANGATSASRDAVPVQIIKYSAPKLQI